MTISNKTGFLIIILSMLLSFFITLYIVKGNHQETDGRPKLKQIYSYTDIRETSMTTKLDYIVDSKKLLYTVDQDGKFEATYTLKHNTRTPEKMVFYILMENTNTPISVKINGIQKKYHVMKVPKKGKVSVTFTISNVPKGNHIVYLFTEIYEEDLNSKNPVEKHNIQTFMSFYYFQLKGKEGVTKAISQKSIKPISVLKADAKKDHSLKLFKDEKLSNEILDSITRGMYYLSFNNSDEFNMRANMYVLNDYEVQNNDPNSVDIAPFTKAVVPIDLSNIKSNNSIRIIMIGIPEKNKTEAPFPVRVAFSTMRFQVSR